MLCAEADTLGPIVYGLMQRRWSRAWASSWRYSTTTERATAVNHLRQLPGCATVRVRRSDGEHDEEWPVLPFQDAKMELMAAFLDRWGEPDALPDFISVDYIDAYRLEPCSISVEVGTRTFVEIEDTLNSARDPLDLHDTSVYDATILDDLTA